jgi:hypothetical protein
MKSLAFLVFVLILTGCSSSKEAEPKKSLPKPATYTEAEVQEARDESYDQGHEEGLTEGNEEGLTEGHDQGYDEGYDVGYNDATDEVAAATDDYSLPDVPPSSETPSIGGIGEAVGGLTLRSDGFEWSVATDYNKKAFIKDLAQKNNEFVTFSDAENIMYAIDDFYSSNGKFNTISDAIDKVH